MIFILIIFSSSASIVFNLPSKLIPGVTPATPGQWWLALVFFLLCGAIILVRLFSGREEPEQPRPSKRQPETGEGYDETKARNDRYHARHVRENDIGNQSLRYQAAAARESHRRGVRFNDDEWEQVQKTADEFATRDVDRRLKR